MGRKPLPAAHRADHVVALLQHRGDVQLKGSEILTLRSTRCALRCADDLFSPDNL